MGISDVRDISLVLAGYYMAKAEDMKSISDCYKYIKMVDSIKVPYKNHSVDTTKLKKSISNSIFNKQNA